MTARKAAQTETQDAELSAEDKLKAAAKQFRESTKALRASVRTEKRTAAVENYGEIVTTHADAMHADLSDGLPEGHTVKDVTLHWTPDGTLEIRNVNIGPARGAKPEPDAS